MHVLVCVCIYIYSVYVCVGMYMCVCVCARFSSMLALELVCFRNPNLSDDLLK